jgi:hypothetical protein
MERREDLFELVHEGGHILISLVQQLVLSSFTAVLLQGRGGKG